ncbi:hypothetical protein B0T10DRAFT_40427 [Thelonectria olida]|uniref:Uncharacterized protein n=1 Tax=Thelonectria olida TaxID=1576542 RepID=A0A9P8W6Y9_9HYPO|nr:hypothetical protein B0T10DRAFT_40427 [Thelonectria olida]
MSTKQNPSSVTKVDLGKDAPVTGEGTGKAASESLATKSTQEGGDFASNRKAENTSGSDESDSYASKAREMAQQSDKPSQSIGSKDSGSGDTQSRGAQRRPSGSHRKNVEGSWDESKDEDGLKKALESEPGSMDDPSRLAEQQYALKQGAHGRDAGPRQDKIEGGTAYDALGSEVPS